MINDLISPIQWVMRSGAPEFLGRFLAIGVDMDSLSESLKASPEQFKSCSAEMRAALQSAIARHVMIKSSSNAASAAANRVFPRP